MDNLPPTEIAQPQDEASVSSEFRAEADSSLETVKTLIEESRANGGLTSEDEAVLRDWLAHDVKAPLVEAMNHDREQRSTLAGQVAETALLTSDHHGVIETPGDREKSSSEDDRPAVSAGRISD